MKKVFLSALILAMVLATTVISAQEVNGAKVAEEETPERVFQFSFISPIGTNWKKSHLTTNQFSINMLGGKSYGNTVLELGGLYNINTHLTKGSQFSGISNYSGNAINAFQFAGVANIASKGTVSAQFSGAVNVADDVRGAQFSGVVNVADDIRGAQFSGVVNVADDVVGGQFALVNTAKKLKGVQIGLINIAEESGGLSIGLINIVKNGGKQEFEISASEAMNTAISFRLGADNFYTISSAGINYLTTPMVEYAVGLGLGTHINWSRGWGNQLELMSYAMTEGGKFMYDDVSLLNQFKFIISKEFARRFKVFAGPVLNMTVSSYENPVTGELGASLAPWSIWKNECSNIRLNAWVGFTAGIRF